MARLQSSFGRVEAVALEPIVDGATGFVWYGYMALD